jgi:hypothetical protein
MVCKLPFMPEAPNLAPHTDARHGTGAPVRRDVYASR